MTILSERLRLEPARREALRAFEHGGEAALLTALAAQAVEGWAGPGALAFLPQAGAFLDANREAADWWVHFFFDRAGGVLIGLGGFKGAPHGGGVEIGYEIAPGRRGQGLATDAAQAMVAHAFKRPEIGHVLAHTEPGETISARVLRRIGFRFVEAVDHPQHGASWRWRID